jgi:putative SOS response-associated peptidase YedK
MDHYLRELAPKQLMINGYDRWPIERYNVAPTTRVEVIRSVGEMLSVDKVRWGWSPFRAKGKRPDPINARVETVMTGRFFKGLWPNGRDGFVIITAASDQGMVDIHDRKPLVLSTAHAREWIDSETSVLRAEELARGCCRPAEDFRWYPVGKSVGNVKNQGADLIRPLMLPTVGEE